MSGARHTAESVVRGLSQARRRDTEKNKGGRSCTSLPLSLLRRVGLEQPSRGRGSTRGEDSTGRDEGAARRAARAARFAADRPVQRVGTGAGGPAGGVNQRTETVQAEAGSGGAGVARAGGMDEVDAGRRGGGGFVRFWVAGVELTVGPYWLLAPNG